MRKTSIIIYIFLYAKNTLFHGCLYFQEEIDGGGYHQHAQQGIEEAGLLATHILYDELGVLRTEEPVPIKQGGEDGEQAHHHKDSLYQIMHSHV